MIQFYQMKNITQMLALLHKKKKRPFLWNLYIFKSQFLLFCFKTEHKFSNGKLTPILLKKKLFSIHVLEKKLYLWLFNPLTAGAAYNRVYIPY